MQRKKNNAKDDFYSRFNRYMTGFFVGAVGILRLLNTIPFKSDYGVLQCVIAIITGIILMVYAYLIFKDYKPSIFRGIIGVVSLILVLLDYMFKQTRSFSLPLTKIVEFNFTLFATLCFLAALSYIALIYDLRIGRKIVEGYTSQKRE